MTSETTDGELLDQLRRGRGEALAALFDRYGRLIFRVARKILHDQSEAEDLMQEIFLEVFRKADQYDPAKGTVKLWLLQYAYHRSFNRRKYLALRHFYDEFPAGALVEADLSGETGGREGLTPQEWQQVLRCGMDELSSSERQIIGMVAFDGLTLREASQRIEETYVNGRNLYYRGLKKLRQFLGRRAPGRETNDVRP
jgi:RNA polymerase sigma-70 factor (ECF subfamily)